MTTKSLLVVLGVGLVAAGLWMVLARPPAAVTVTNVDPPGLPYTLVLLRTGPGSEYERTGFLNPGTTAQAVGRDDAGGWLLLAEPAGWLSITAGDVEGDVDSLPVTDEVLPAPAPITVRIRNPESGSPIQMRLGPSEAFAVIAERALGPGETAIPVARDATADWVLTDLHGWLPVAGLDVAGNLDDLPILRIEF